MRHARPAAWPGSQQPLLGKRKFTTRSNDNVVQNPYIQQAQGSNQALSDTLVCTAGLGHSRGMVMSENHCSRADIAELGPQLPGGKLRLRPAFPETGPHSA